MNKNTSIVSQHPIVRGLKEECKYRSNPPPKKNPTTKHTHANSIFFKNMTFCLYIFHSRSIFFMGHFFINAVVLVKIVLKKIYIYVVNYFGTNKL